ncbi:isoleucine--tRNA ligase [Buchnera aphidicola (Hyadaphis tataricae)]|uniref:Isoleucine--tRNA ligase n=1 Tax=Buchnera aphidicola (Hyadaphis tataricae) TaxID=1241859 RepID=A0A4D6XVP0_9GAMM|nr:isoleucine--tRNA ligase [Buchnera aphidicola]QCI21466.1 isoleucine--tRNA ligase [Buchnera aphidicola (Hyadaphis tataricae)]
MNDYKKTLNLPKTTFSMKANLSKKEPKILTKWQENNIYTTIRKKKASKKIFFLHDGPPYANGSIHIGHAVNKILKDIIIKSKNMSGFDAPYIPSWDCHGLPIEQKIEENCANDQKKSIIEFQKNCRTYASDQVAQQKKDFIRLGVIGDWDNPHLTMDFKNEANIIRTLSKIIQKQHLYKDFKPIYWCTSCASSLSEAEIEYKEKKSNAIIVAFKNHNKSTIKKLFNYTTTNNKETYLPIWTTTPWTLPSSKAIAINADFQYQLIETQEKNFIIAKALSKKVLNILNIKEWTIVDTIKGEKLENIIFCHPFLRNIYLPVILGTHVTLDVGTGAVHTAPDHGPDDYKISKKYNIEISHLVDDKGFYIKNVHPRLDGVNVFKSNKIIINILNEKKLLLHHDYLLHNYPHCWRHKSPIIFRATPQWFIKISKSKLLDQALKEIKQVLWIPNWGQSRMREMIKKRPDWCISRQRRWGVPMSIFIDKKTGEMHPKTVLLMEKIATIIEKKGIQAWWHMNIKEILGDEHLLYEKNLDILDVWFESGNTHTSINYQNQKYNKNFADMYLEGSDQHRGWFMSSLVISTLINNKAPYSQVLTHGFVVDKTGQKMSKSIGNTISPNKIIDKFGADVLRLWVASSNYTNDISISDEILKNTAETYRRIRNTARFILSNISDFNPQQDLISKDNMVYLDKWAISHTHMVQKEIIHLYKTYNFHSIIKRIAYFCSMDMGSFYLDIIKDRQYTLKAKSQERKSSQTTMYYILHALVRWIAPILSFTADEIWDYLKQNNSECLFTEEWFNKLFVLDSNDLYNHHFWNQMIAIKHEINIFIEKAIKKQIINNALESSITIYVSEKLFNTLKMLKTELKFLFLTSEIKIKTYEQAPDNATKINNIASCKILLKKITGKKCLRCWHYFSSTNNNTNQDICNRCILNTIGDGERRIFI